jgi:hypothetical protein
MGDEAGDDPFRPLRLLIIDIETSPHLAHIWSLWDQNTSLNHLVDVSSVICFAAKWHGDKKVMYHSDHLDGHDAMVAAAHRLMCEADGIIHYNGRAFDMKHLRREFVLADMPPPSPHKDIDLLSVVRKNFKFASNKVQHVSVQLGLGGKAETGGFELWKDCLADCPRAWARMRRYNIQDVKLTEQVYDRLLPWIDNHPHRGLYGVHPLGRDICQRCGSGEMHRRGTTTTSVGKYVRYQCQGCGSWSRGKDRVASVNTRAIAS